MREFFRHQFAVKLASYPLRVVFPEGTGLSFLLRGEMLGKGDGELCGISSPCNLLVTLSGDKGEMPIVYLLAISFTGKLVALFKGMR